MDDLHIQTPLLLFLVPLLVVALVATTAFWIWALVDCVNRESQDHGGKIGWLVLIAVFHWVGALCYLLFRRSKRSQNRGQD